MTNHCHTMEESTAVNAVTIHDLCFGYEQSEVLHNVELAIPQGDFAVIVGPNGGGKTTLLRLMLGLLQPRYGCVHIFDAPPQQRREVIGYVPQALTFDPNFPVSVMDVLLMARVHRHAFGGYDRTDREAAQQALAEVGLAGMEKRPFAALSGGQRQRVLIAQALTTQPRLLLLDEPCANLDAEGINTVHTLLQELNHRMTVVMVSHNLGMVESFARHVICVNRTADMHAIQDVSTPDLAAGNWVRISHHACPVTRDEAAEICRTPHRGADERLQHHCSCCHK